jgi:3-dehydroquinate synthase
MAESLNVNLGARSYTLHFDQDLDEAVEQAMERYTSAGRKVVILTDSNVARTQSARLARWEKQARVFVTESGETAKSLATFGSVLDFLAQEKVDRGGALFAVGGGVIGDLGGFSAASWLRGIDFFQVPTTLLAMVDSSVGGKTGINIAAGKNLVGAFHQPKAVFVSTDVLKTLPTREFAAGMAEVIKSALLGDTDLLARLEKSPLTISSLDLAWVIRRCCALKAKIVEADERELAKEGGRALLNLGHTFGHAIENVAGYGAYLHGEAVAIGLCAAARLSQKMGLIAAEDEARVLALVTAHGLATRLNSPLAISDLSAAMGRDKKVRAGALRFVVLKKLGEAITHDEVSKDLADDAWRSVGAV